MDTPPSATNETPARAGRLSRGVAGAALLIGGITIAAKTAGFARNLVFSHTVGTDCLATAYFTGNQVTNIVFEIVAGGALASMVVPVLAGPAEQRSPEVRRIASALLSWTVLILVPLSFLAALLAHPVMSLLVPAAEGCSRGEVIDLGARMLVAFAPQIVFYGLAVVLYGVLQAHRRFLGPALAPLLSSLVVIGAYLSFVSTGAAYRQAVERRHDDLGLLTRAGELTLSVGTTLGVVALVATVIWPMTRLRLRLRPTLSFPPGVAARIRRLAVAGLATLIAQQAAWTVVIVLANGQGGAGALAVYQYAWALFQLPYAVLAVPLATSAFPVLSAQAGDAVVFDRTTAATTRGIVLLSCAGAAVLGATALPVARVFLLGTGGQAAPSDLALAIVAFAPGLLGYGLIAHVGRALYAAGNGRASALAQVGGWGVVIVAEVAFAVSVARPDVVGALALGNTVGLTVAGLLLLLVLVRTRKGAAVSGVARALLVGLLGGAGGYGAGVGVVAAFGQTDLYASVGVAVLAALVAGLVFLAVAYVFEGRDLRALLRVGNVIR